MWKGQREVSMSLAHEAQQFLSYAVRAPPALRNELLAILGDDSLSQSEKFQLVLAFLHAHPERSWYQLAPSAAAVNAAATLSSTHSEDVYDAARMLRDLHHKKRGVHFDGKRRRSTKRSKRRSRK